ncbi:hypothetical protein ACWDFL_29055 [Streptomyces bungoensis]
MNQNFLPGTGRRPRRRHHYSYALFSTTGFSSSAQRFALAHQISLVDLSGDSFAWLRGLIRSTASQLLGPGARNGVPANLVTWIRSTLRDRLHTPRESTEAPDSPSDGWEPTTPADDAMLPALNGFATALADHTQAELLLGFPAAPFILPLHTNDRQAFLAHASQQPAHPVGIRRTNGRRGAEWVITPMQVGPEAYRLTFTLPEHVEKWIAEADADQERRRSATVRRDLLSNITIYRLTDAKLSVYQLTYVPADLRRG